MLCLQTPHLIMLHRNHGRWTRPWGAGAQFSSLKSQARVERITATTSQKGFFHVHCNLKPIQTSDSITLKESYENRRECIAI